MEPRSTIVTVAAVDLDAATAFLADRYSNQVTTIETLRQGAWSSAYGFERDGTPYVIRFSNHLDDFQRDRHAHRYVGPNLPIPIVTEIGEAFGAHYAISERKFGTPIDTLDGPAMRALLPSLFAMLDGLRRADISSTRGYGGWDADRVGSHASWADFLLAANVDDPESRGGGWKTTLEQSRLGMTAYNEVYVRLQRAVHVAPAERFLVLSDLLNYNMLVHGNAVSGVIDWGCSLYGDFLYDLAWIVFWAPWYPAWNEIDFLAEARQHYAEIGLLVPNFEERMRLCLIHIGITHISYNAFIGDIDTAEVVAERTLLLSD